MKVKKLIQSITLILSFVVMNQFANAQHCNCSDAHYGCGYNNQCILRCASKCAHFSVLDGATSLTNEVVGFNSAAIRFSIDQCEKVSLAVFDMAGRLVKTLADGTFEKGDHQLLWNVASENSGMYLLRMNTGSFSETQTIPIIN